MAKKSPVSPNPNEPNRSWKIKPPRHGQVIISDGKWRYIDPNQEFHGPTALAVDGDKSCCCDQACGDCCGGMTDLGPCCYSDRDELSGVFYYARERTANTAQQKFYDTQITVTQDGQSYKANECDWRVPMRVSSERSTHTGNDDCIMDSALADPDPYIIPPRGNWKNSGSWTLPVAFFDRNCPWLDAGYGIRDGSISVDLSQTCLRAPFNSACDCDSFQYRCTTIDVRESYDRSIEGTCRDPLEEMSPPDTCDGVDVEYFDDCTTEDGWRNIFQVAYTVAVSRNANCRWTGSECVCA